MTPSPIMVVDKRKKTTTFTTHPVMWRPRTATSSTSPQSTTLSPPVSSSESPVFVEKIRNNQEDGPLLYATEECSLLED